MPVLRTDNYNERNSIPSSQSCDLIALGLETAASVSHGQWSSFNKQYLQLAGGLSTRSPVSGAVWQGYGTFSR